MNAEDSEDGEKDFSPDERKRLRRILEDDLIRRRLKTTAKVWVTTLGVVAAAVLAVKTVWTELVLRAIK